MTDIRFLFRFRDLVARTIEEHSAIITQKNACWWGWWKRPSEDNRQAIWDRLDATASKQQPVAVGLFDSGNGLVYRAWVTDIISPMQDAHGVQLHPPVPQGDEGLIPEYYRASPFSFAWMRLVTIEKQSLEFFGAYSFAEVPHLPNYNPSVLSRFKGKVVLEPDELRGMDTTIWEVRLKQQGDEEARILLTTPALPSSVSREPARTQSNTVLHITDPHFAVGKNRDQHVWRLEDEANRSDPTMAEAIATALQGKPIGAIIVTGDLTFTGETEEFLHAERSLRRLLGILDLGVDHLVVILHRTLL